MWLTLHIRGSRPIESGEGRALKFTLQRLYCTAQYFPLVLSHHNHNTIPGYLDIVLGYVRVLIDFIVHCSGNYTRTVTIQILHKYGG